LEKGKSNHLQRQNIFNKKIEMSGEILEIEKEKLLKYYLKIQVLQQLP